MNNRFISKAQRLSQVAAWVGGLILLLTSILIAIEVVLRKVFTVSMGGADEISSYAMAISCSFGFSYALFQKAHIRIDVLYNKCPQVIKYVLDILSLTLLGLYMIVLSYFGFIVFWTSFVKDSTANTPLHTPLWIPQLIWVIGLSGFAISIILILAGTIYSLVKKDFKTAGMLSGVATLKDEIEKETAVSDTLDMAAPGGEK
ncbi:TRAP transporter small permease [Desulfococcaceae bacterium HSG7]|nr:TRAP transporter small permease [Desulfococcaceae bacterium HSG9]MDM8553532.1 TRAP transporter small permease [Desulfococcaceae bacterium HSG7]